MVLTAFTTPGVLSRNSTFSVSPAICSENNAQDIQYSHTRIRNVTMTATPKTNQSVDHSNIAQENITTPQNHNHVSDRVATVDRKTRETNVSVTVNVDGTGKCDVDTGIPFLDHMLAQLCSHGLFDLYIRAQGDLWIDDHHTNEDVGITLGMALAKAIKDKRGIQRFGHFVAPLDEALVEIVLDFSGRGHCEYGLNIPTQRVGTYDTQLVREFYHALATNAQMTIHVVPRAGINSHHIIEASFKALARAMRMALAYDDRRLGQIPSSKGVLSDNVAIKKNGAT